MQLKKLSKRLTAGQGKRRKKHIAVRKEKRIKEQNFRDKLNKEIQSNTQKKVGLWGRIFGRGRII